MPQPLSHLKILSLALNLPGPACVRRLADAGAHVTKVEPPAEKGGDPLATYAPAYYAHLHAGITVRTLDLKNGPDRAQLDALLADADVLITAQRNSALERLGLAESLISARFSSLLHIAIHGYADGETPGHDLTYMAEAGLVVPPNLPRTLLADLAGAERAYSATLQALLTRAQTGRGARVEVSLAEAAAAFAAPLRFGLTGEGTLLGGAHPGYNFYRVADGWIALAALEPHFLARVAALLGCEATQSAFASAFVRHPQQHWLHMAQVHDFPLVPLGSISESR